MMRFALGALGALIAVALAEPARGQEFGISGVSGQVWDAGPTYHFGWGVSLGVLTKASEMSNRGGLRFTFDVLRRGRDSNVPPIAEFTGPDVGATVVDGPADATRLRVLTVRWVFLPHINQDARAEFSVGGAHEQGQNAVGFSALLGTGVSFRLSAGRPYWLNLAYEQRFNRNSDPQAFNNPTRQMRGTYRLGLVVEPSRPTP